jgi:heme-degrading monooxygenase HmoA
MFARCVIIPLKPNSVAEFNRTLEKEVLPLLQKQKGFRDELILVAPNGAEVLGISLWDQKEDAEAYHRTAFPEVQKLLAKLIEGNLRVQAYEVSTSTTHKVAARGVSG